MRTLLWMIFFAPWLLLAGTGANTEDWKRYSYHAPGTALVFPNDDGNHPEYNEWRYFNFHLR